jgi:hypothetical protein
MYARGIGVMPETVEAVEMVREVDPDDEWIEHEHVVWYAAQCGACPDATLLLSQFVMPGVEENYVSFFHRFTMPLVVWSREVARAILAMGVPLDGAKFVDSDGNKFTPDDLFAVGHMGSTYESDLPEISTAESVWVALEQYAEPPLQRAA